MLSVFIFSDSVICYMFAGNECIFLVHLVSEGGGTGRRARLRI